MKPYRPLDTIKVKDGMSKEEKDLVAIESVLELTLDGEFVASFICSPGNEKNLSIGYLLSMGIIDSYDDIKAVEYSGNRCNVHSKPGAHAHMDRDITRVRRVVSTECSAPELLRILRTGRGLPSVSENIDVKLADIMHFSNVLRRSQEIRSRTGATHGALVADLSKKDYVLAEDLGRHNAVDKAIGLAIEEAMNLGMSMLISTGRLTADIVSKSVWADVPLLVSFAVATETGVVFAEKGNVTLVGALRKNHMRIYHNGAAKISLDSDTIS